MVPIVTALVQQGLRLVANAFLVKGKDFIKEKTGVDLDKATLSPEELKTLKAFEAEHEEELMRLRLEENKLGLEETKALLADVDSARKYMTQQVTDVNTPGYVKKVGPILAIGTVFLTFVMFFYFANISCKALDPTQKDIIIYILGVLSTISTQIFSYYFGSSQGSAEKSRSIDRLYQNSQGRES